MATELGEKIRSLRKSKGYSLDKLAELSKTSKSRIWELENRNKQRPSAEKIMSIASALDVTSDFLLSTGEEEPREEAVDRAFYRNYKKMPTETKKKIRKMVKIWSDGE
jgi:transcriptional regulator with XRE-family HTH domain